MRLAARRAPSKVAPLHLAAIGLGVLLASGDPALPPEYSSSGGLVTVDFLALPDVK